MLSAAQGKRSGASVMRPRAMRGRPSEAPPRANSGCLQSNTGLAQSCPTGYFQTGLRNATSCGCALQLGELPSEPRLWSSPQGGPYVGGAVTCTTTPTRSKGKGPRLRLHVALWSGYLSITLASRRRDSTGVPRPSCAEHVALTCQGRKTTLLPLYLWGVQGKALNADYLVYQSPWNLERFA